MAQYLVLLLLLSLNLPAGADSASAKPGRWTLTETNFPDEQPAEPLRELILDLEPDGRATLSSCIISTSYRMTTSGCKVNTTRRDPSILHGTYHEAAGGLVFDWATPLPFAGYFLARGSSWYWPAEVRGDLMVVTVPPRVLTFRRSTTN